MQTQPFGNMSGDMAVHEPGARVVGFESDDDIAAPGHEDDVAAGWVVEFQVEVRSVEFLVVGLLEEGEVVAVEVDGVGDSVG